MPLFNGKNLDGWTGDAGLWKVANGVIVGSIDDTNLKHNSFLSTTKSYKNFVLKARFKLHDGNSGIQFRSKQLDDYVVRGYQADIDLDKWNGVLYEERGRGTLADVNPDDVKKHVNQHDWNEYVITADGPHIKQQINGFTTVDYVEKNKRKGETQGIIALQLHIPKTRVEFKDIEIKELP